MNNETPEAHTFPTYTYTKKQWRGMSSEQRVIAKLRGETYGDFQDWWGGVEPNKEEKNKPAYRKVLGKRGARW